jgi:hypothetical protein
MAYGHASHSLLVSTSGGRLKLRDLPDNAACSFNKRQIVGQTALKQHADAEVSGGVGRRNEHHVFSDSEVSQMDELG